MISLILLPLVGDGGSRALDRNSCTLHDGSEHWICKRIKKNHGSNLVKNLVHWVFTEEVSILKTLWFEESKFDSCAVQIAGFDKIKTFEGMRKTGMCNHLNKSFPVVLLITLYKVVLISESVNEIWKCDHSKESYWAVLSCGTVYYVVQGV